MHAHNTAVHIHTGRVKEGAVETIGVAHDIKVSEALPEAGEIVEVRETQEVAHLVDNGAQAGHACRVVEEARVDAVVHDVDSILCVLWEEVWRGVFVSDRQKDVGQTRWVC